MASASGLAALIFVSWPLKSVSFVADDLEGRDFRAELRQLLHEVVLRLDAPVASARRRRPTVFLPSFLTVYWARVRGRRRRSATASGTCTCRRCFVRSGVDADGVIVAEVRLRVDGNGREGRPRRVVAEDGQDASRPRRTSGPTVAASFRVRLVVLDPDDDLPALDPTRLALTSSAASWAPSANCLPIWARLPVIGRRDADDDVLGAGRRRLPATRAAATTSEARIPRMRSMLMASLLTAVRVRGRGEQGVSLGGSARARPRRLRTRPGVGQDGGAGRRRTSTSEVGLGAQARCGRDPVGRGCPRRPRWRPCSTAAFESPQARSRASSSWKRNPAQGLTASVPTRTRPPSRA